MDQVIPSDPRSPAVTPAEAMMDSALALSPGGLLYARAAVPQLRLESRDPRRFVLLTPWHEFSGDLSQGLVLQALRGPEGPSGTPVCHSGNMLQYRHRGRTVSLDVEANIVDFGIRRLPGRVVLFHESRFERAAGPLGRRRPFARLRYDYTVQASSPVLRLAVTLTAEPGCRISLPRVTTALDAVSPAGAAAVRRVVAWGPGGKAARHLGAAGASLLHEGAAHHLMLPMEPVPGEPGDAAAPPAGNCHLRLEDGHLLAGVTGTPQADGALHWLLLRYAGPMLPGGSSMVIREERLRLGEGALDPAPDSMEQAIGSALSVALGLHSGGAAWQR